MKVEIKYAITDEEKEAIYKLRYQVYVNELNIFHNFADHRRKILKDDHDNTARLIYATCDDKLIGSVRLNWGGDSPFTKEHRETYDLDRFLSIIGTSQIVVISRFMVKSKLRGGTVPSQLMRAIAEFGIKHKTELVFCDCQPHLISLYKSMGFRTYLKPYNDPAFGIMIPLVLVTSDTDFLKSIGSPFLIMLEEWSPSPLLNQILRLIPDKPPIYDSLREFMSDDWEEVCAILNQISEGSGNFFDGLSEDQVSLLLTKSHIIKCSCGDVIIRRGQKTRTIFVVLSGIIEARFEEKIVNVVAAGNSIGEIAFLLGIPRTVDIYAASDDVKILCLNEKSIQNLMKSDSDLAFQLMHNLATGLAYKLIKRDYYL